MNILIVGAGKVGMHLAKDMSERKHSVKLVEINPAICENAGIVDQDIEPVIL